MDSDDAIGEVYTDSMSKGTTRTKNVDPGVDPFRKLVGKSDSPRQSPTRDRTN